MKRCSLLLLLACLAAACQQEGPTVASEGPAFAKGGIPGKPGGGPGKPDDGATAEIKLCAKKHVVDDINLFDERPDPPWLDAMAPNSAVPDCSPDSDCAHGNAQEGCASGTLTYSTSGPEFKWKFSGKGFIPNSHNYVLIIYDPDRDPDNLKQWPGLHLICLEGWEEKVKANLGTRLRFSGSLNLTEYVADGDLTDAELWIVRLGWVDCTGEGFLYPWDIGHENRHDQQRALSNDLDGELWGYGDATWSCGRYTQSGCVDDYLAYDWLFPATTEDLVTYDDTDTN